MDALQYPVSEGIRMQQCFIMIFLVSKPHFCSSNYATLMEPDAIHLMNFRRRNKDRCNPLDAIRWIDRYNHNPHMTQLNCTPFWPV